MLDLSRLSSLATALSDAMVPFKTNLALIESDRERETGRWTYRELRAEAERVAALLQSGGFAPGDRCAILMANQSKWIFSGLGAIWAGAVLVPLDYKLTAAEQAALIAHARPRVLIVEWPVWRTLVREAAAAPAGMRVLVTEAPADADLGRAERWEKEPSLIFHEVRRTREDVACIVYSSGTGGVPKGCMLTHANYLEQAQVLGRLYPLEESDRYFSILPTNHAIDFMCGFLLPLLMGAAIVHQRTLRPQYLSSTMKRYGITHMALVPLILKTLETKIREKLDELPEWKRKLVDGLIAVNELATQRRPRHELSATILKPIHDSFGGKLRRIFAGGAFVDRACAEFFYRLGFPVVIGYGLTEAGTVLTVNDLEPFRADTVGRPIPGVTIELRNRNDQGVGEVWVQGPTVMKGYLDAPELTAETLVDGWLRTGDLGEFDAAGHLKLVGRTKNMIVTEGGKNIYPEDVENAFDGLTGCKEYAVFAANYLWPTGTMTGEQLLIVVRPDGDAVREATVREIQERNRKLADFKRLSGYVVWTRDFPRTASLKLKRLPLAQEIAKSGAREAALKPL